jgi:hypothetical protein
VCEAWRKSFDSFVQDMAPRPGLKYSIERRDNNLGYSPENCFWATAKQQARNRRSNRVVVFRGVRRVLQEWAEITGLNHTTIAHRLDHGWSVERALTEPVRLSGG